MFSPENRGDIRKVSEKYDISMYTAKKYLGMTEHDICALDNPRKNERKKKKWMDEYANIIYKMTADGIEAVSILSYIKQMNYPGTDKSLANLIYHIQYNNFGIVLNRDWYQKYEYANNITVITRRELLKYITSRKGNEKVGRHIDLIKDKYPIVKELDEIYCIFHHILMNKKEDEVDLFIKHYKNSSLKKYVEGIKKDIAPVKNAISFEESSGFVEGNNNKFKLIKRIVYGRSDLINLFSKCYPAFLIGKDNFDIKKALLNSVAYTHY